MALAYQAFLKKGIDLAPLGWETNGAFIPYFCTPKGAKVLGWAGVDGIHYCTIRGFGDMIFAVSPMNVRDYVHPIARNFEDLLRLLLSCTDMAALEQCYAWDEEQYKAFLMDCPATPEQQAVLDAIRSKTSLEPMEDSFHYVKKLQAEFDLSAIPYTEDYYDEDMNPAVPKEAPQWKATFDGSFWGHPKGQRPGKEIPVNTQFDWAGRHWIIPSVYSCSKGLVVDFCMRVEPADILSFMDKWHLCADADEEQFTREQRMQMELDNPMCMDFRPILRLNGKELRFSHGCEVSYIPCLPGRSAAEAEQDSKQAIAHYQLDTAFGWVIHRFSYPWATKKKPEIKHLSATMVQQEVSISGPHFQVEKPGDTFSFVYPEGGTEYTLTVQEYEEQVLETSRMMQDMEHPTYYYFMSYTVTPEFSGGDLDVADCSDGDRPRPKPCPSKLFELTVLNDALVIGIIGGSDGPTAIVCGQPAAQGKLGAACSSLHFDPVDRVEWRLVFHEKRYQDKTFDIQTGSMAALTKKSN